MKPELAQALLAAQKDLAKLKLVKTTEGQEGRRTYKYLPLDQMLDQVLPVLHKAGLLLYQAPIYDHDGQALRTSLIHESGEEISDVMKLAIADGTGPKAQGSSISYGRRYALLAALGLAPDEDDDGDAAEPKAKAKAKTEKKNGAKYTPEQREKLKTLIGRLEEHVPKPEGQQSWMQDAQHYAKTSFDKQIAQLDGKEMDALIERVEKWIEEEALPIA